MLANDIASNNKTHKVALFVALVVVVVTVLVTVADNFTLTADEYAFCFFGGLVVGDLVSWRRRR